MTAALFTVTAVAALGLALRYHLGVAQTLVTVLLSGGAPAALYLTWATYRLSAMQTLDQAAEVSVAEVADSLASAIQAQWQAEARERRLYDPYPLPIRWQPADESVVEEWDRIVAAAASWSARPGTADRDAWAVDPSALAGTGGEIVTVLARVPSGRLAVLGEPGSGKTMLMVRLVLDLLAVRNSGEPVPVLVSAASWDPSSQDLRRWLEMAMSTDYPFLADPALFAGRATTRVGALLEDGLILPILDGFDEIPDVARGPAIARINDAFQPGQPFVVTCRTAAFNEAVRPGGGIEITLRAVAGIELLPLDTNTVADYLCTDAGGPVGASRWEPVLEILGTRAPLAEVLSTPLMAGLARIIYNPRPGERTGTLRDPAELAMLREPAAIEEHLLDAFIPAAYRQAAGSPDRQSQRYAQHSEKWLTFLARHLQDNIHGTDLVWWQLPKATPPLVTSLAAGLIAGFASMLAIGVTIPLVGLVYYGLSGEILTAFKVAISWMLYGLKFAPVVALASGLIVSVAAWMATVYDESENESQSTRKRLVGIAVFGCTSALLICLAIWFELRPTISWLVTVGLISAVVICGGNIYAIQRHGVNLNLRKGVLAGIAVGVVLGLTFMIVVGYYGGTVFGIHFGITFGIISGFAGGLAAVIADAVGQRPSRGPHWNVRRGSRAAGSAVIVAGLGSWYAFQSATFGLVFALAFGIAAGIIAGLEGTPSDPAATASPQELRARDRKTTLVLTLATGVAGGVAAGIVCGALYGSPVSMVGAASAGGGGLVIGLAFGLSLAIGTGMAVALTFGLAIGVFGLVWPQWIVARAWLALRQDLPRDLDTFLSDAYKRGVLRRVGAAYQFRHIELQHRLACISQSRAISASLTGQGVIHSELNSNDEELEQCRRPKTIENPALAFGRFMQSLPVQASPLGITRSITGIGLRRTLIVLGVLVIYSAALFGSLLLTGVLPITSRSGTTPFNVSLPGTAPVASPLASHRIVKTTKHFVFEPWSAAGLSKSIKVAATVKGYCWAQSINSNRPDAYRCFGRLHTRSLHC